MTSLGVTIHTLTDVAYKPETTIRNRLSAVRRFARILQERMELIVDERIAIGREATKLREHLPYTRHSVEQLVQKASNHRDGDMERARLALEEIGSVIAHDQLPELEVLALSDFAALLNINAVDLEQARRDGASKLSGVAFIQKLEDSASLRRIDWSDGPLFCAYWR